ncbi:MAG: L,D-transpeptidase, partial [Solirubrobacterales bacterium]
MSRVGKTLVLVAAVLLVGAAHASAWEIVRPFKLKVPYSAEPGGEAIGKVSAETRGGEVAGFLLLERKRVEGIDWFGVRIGQRPNDKVGWIQETRAYTVDARYRVHISLENRMLALFRDRDLVWKVRVVVGAPATPTPEGLFAVHDFYRVFDDL